MSSWVHLEVEVGYTHPGARPVHLSQSRLVQGVLDVVPIHRYRSINDDLHEIHCSRLDQESTATASRTSFFVQNVCAASGRSGVPKRDAPVNVGVHR